MPRRRLGLAALAVVVLVALAGVAWPWLDAARLLLSLADPHAAIGPHSPQVYAVDGRQRSGDVYPGSSATGLVLMPGAAVLGKDDPRMQAFASALAHAGFTVLIPDSESEKTLHLGPENVDEVADAVHWLASQRSAVGVLAISYGVGPAVLAGLREGNRLSFLVGIGGYDDLTAVIGFATTGWYDGRKLVPNVYGKWLFARANAARLWDSGDRTLLEVIAQQAMAGGDPSPLAQRLTSTARPIYDLLTNEDPARVPDLISHLPAAMRDDISALDLKGRDLSGLKARLLLVHGLDDAIVPAGESIKLAAAVPSAQLFLLPDLMHADWHPGNLLDQWPALQAMHAVLAERR